MTKKEAFYLNPLTDFGFNRVFGNEENKDLLIHFLNACISQYVGTITYVSRLVSKNAVRGKRIYDIAPVYSFNILDYDSRDFSSGDEKEFFWQVLLKDNHNRIFSEKIMLFFIELTKFAAQISRTDCKDEMSKWLYLLKNIAQMNEQDSSRESSIFRKFYETCQLSKLTTMEKEEYTKSVLEYEDVQDALNYMRRTSLEEGFEKGLAEGVSKGKAEGEAETKLAMAKSMLENGIDLNTIISITALTAEEIEG